jgi:amino acid adenylation domain-containing protein
VRYLLHQAVENAADRYPDREAVRFSGERLTYAELLGRTNRLARVLREQGVMRGDRVGIYLPKSLESVVAVYGIMKAGAAYVPLDPFAPAARLSSVIGDCGIRHLITKAAKLDGVQQLVKEQTGLECVIGLEPQADLLVRTVSWEEVDNTPAGSVPDVGTSEQDIAYILYTSGSTGHPKGIVHTHRSGLSFAQWAAKTYSLDYEDRLSNHAPLHFDLSTFDLFAGGLAGATTVIIPETLTKFPASLSRLIEDERITVWYSVPLALTQLLLRGSLPARDLSALRWVLFAGEVFPTKHLRQLMAQLPHARFSNLYGPTETNVCTYYHVDQLPQDSDAPIPIGQPCANVETLVLDEQDQPAAAGEVGELVVRGATVMRGYWGRSDLNARCFYRPSASNRHKDLFYRTGDLVRCQADGHYHYLGRKDRQIKTRGYRVELDEVEVALLAHADVQEAAVSIIADSQGNHWIVAAVIPRTGTTLTPQQLVRHVANKLPPYAIPAHLSIVDDFPRTSSGKIDRIELQNRYLAIQALVPI